MYYLTKLHHETPIVHSGHTSIVLLSIDYRGRSSTWFAPNPGFHFISPGVIKGLTRSGSGCNLRIIPTNGVFAMAPVTIPYKKEILHNI
jgi:hypothetical protein